jgi:hypothetical protein
MNRLVRAGRTWLLWLALALAAAHSFAIWHAYSHSIAEAASDPYKSKHSAGLAHCGLCIASAGIDGAAPAQPMLLPRLAQQVAHTARFTAPPPAPQRRPYAIRAPPTVAS